MKKITGILYRRVIKKILFLFPADTVHAFFLDMGRWIGKSIFFKKILRMMWKYEDSSLEQIILGLHFKNPVGLSAGFDYNADLIDVVPDMGFGFSTIGTLTHEPYAGNPAPMLGRLPKSRSLLVNKGFKNESINTVLAHVSTRNGKAIRGVSIGVTNKAYESYEEMINNLIVGFQEAEKFDTFDFYELNISCPNLRNIKHLTEQLASKEGLHEALTRLAALKIQRPIFIKMPLEKSLTDMGLLIESIVPFPFIQGLIFSNLVKDRTNKAFDKNEIAHAGTGNFSGKPVEEKSNELLQFAYKKYNQRFILIGTGGVFTAADAYKKITSGASLIQMITGMIYQGPQVIGEINQGVVALLKKDGYTHITQAIGRDVL
jgi:dihydroorotate dehydrogenase subfamily 2